MRTIVFDLDGTLADTAPDMIAAANDCFRERGAGDQLDPVTDRATGLRGGRALLRLGYERLGYGSGGQVEADYDHFLEAYGARLGAETTLYPGVTAVLDDLAAAGHPAAVCTNKPLDLAERLLAHLGLAARFDALVGAGSLPVTKPDPAPLRAAIDRAGGDRARAVLVGDTRTDFETGAAAGVPVVLVRYGPGAPDLAGLTPAGWLDRFADLPDVLARLYA